MSTEPSAAVTPRGFDLATITVTPAAGEARELHVWVADTPAERGLGLMGVTDLGDGDGMLFIFEDVGIRRFYMWQTPMPLSVAFFDDAGEFVDSAEMVPCLDPPVDDCERYAPDEPFLAAIEVPSAALDNLGIAEGSRISLPDSAGGP